MGSRRYYDATSSTGKGVTIVGEARLARQEPIGGVFKVLLGTSGNDPCY
jgi:hypothetical protein